MYFIRKLDSYDVSKSILETVYRSLVESVLMFNMHTWYGNLGAKNKNRLTKIVNTASKIIGKGQKQLGLCYETQVKQKAQQIVSDSMHPLFREFIKMPSGRRFRAATATKNIYKKSSTIIPTAITLLYSK